MEPAALDWASAQLPPHRLADVAGDGPADVAAVRALTRVEVAARGGIDDANVATAKALDPQRGHLSPRIGLPTQAASPRTRDR
jgi:hypothetical protein